MAKLNRPKHSTRDPRLARAEQKERKGLRGMINCASSDYQLVGGTKTCFVNRFNILPFQSIAIVVSAMISFSLRDRFDIIIIIESVAIDMEKRRREYRSLFLRGK